MLAWNQGFCAIGQSKEGLRKKAPRSTGTQGAGEASQSGCHCHITCVINRSRSQLYTLIDEVWLDEPLHVQVPTGQCLLDVEGLKKILQVL